jgi:acetyl esterase/lipase
MRTVDVLRSLLRNAVADPDTAFRHTFLANGWGFSQNLRMLRRFGVPPMLLLALIGYARVAAGQVPAAEPTIHVFASPGGTDLNAYVFTPKTQEPGGKRAAIVIFHGGGWNEGEPSWAFARASHFAERGLVAVAAQYRLSDGKTITPLDAMADARAIIRWMRSQAASLGLDPSRIVADGWSAGAHLAASAAIFDDRPGEANRVSAAPNALVLVSPAVALESDGWAQRLLGSKTNVSDVSPDAHVRTGLPPTIILQGSTDTVTPLPGVKRFCDRMIAAGNVCELHVYEGFGHLFTPAGIPDNGQPKPDPATRADALAKAERFLKSLGYIR